MKEHPIPFLGEMVRAILEGRKTQTRRVIKLPPDAEQVQYWTTPTDRTQAGYANPGVNYWTESGNNIKPCPYGQPGDRLWVRETWNMVENDKEADCLQFAADVPDPENYKPWKPSIYMPRWASRINLEIIKIRVERIQEITEEDAIAEGAPLGRVLGYGRLGMESHREGFIDLWDEINDKRGFGWLSNPWVWVIEFRRVENG